jgi:phage I-like protein
VTVRRFFDSLRSNVSAPPASLPAAENGQRWNQLFPFGKRYRDDFPDGELEFNDAFFAAMVRNFEKVGADLPVDYFHRGSSDNSQVRNDDKVAAGWITALKVVKDSADSKQNGLWGLFKWNDKARKQVLADELRYLSPTFVEERVDPTTGEEQGPTLFGAGLLNDPFLQDLPKVAASRNSRSTKELSMDHAAICKHFGLPDDTTPDELSAHMKAFKKPAPAGDPATDAPAADPAAKADPASSAVQVHVHKAVEPLKRELSEKDKQVTALSGRIAALEAEKKAATEEALVAELIQKDNIDPADKESVVEFARHTSVEKAKAFFSKQVAATKRGELGLPPGPSMKLTAGNPGEAMKTLDEQIKALQEGAEKLSLKDATKRVYSSPDNVQLIEMANTAQTKNPRFAGRN